MRRPSQGGQQPPNTQTTATPRVTRLAPSPTGALHLGNARTFLINWAIARQRGWRVAFRVEDLDGPRVKPGAAEGAIGTLRWLGLDWDGEPLVQSHDLSPYVDAMKILAREGLAYPCALTRAEIDAAASAPHGRSASVGQRRPSPTPPTGGRGSEATPLLRSGMGSEATPLPQSGRGEGEGAGSSESRFPPELRPTLEPRTFDDAETNWRFAAPDGTVSFTDAFSGAQRIDPSRSVGDFVTWTKRAQPAYQLAVVVDDHRQGITDVVRGDDLLDSVARQLLLYRALHLAPEPAYTHLPLVVGDDGRRLAKRHGDTRLDAYRERGVHRDRVIGLIASWSGVLEKPEPMTPEAFVSAFNLANLPPAAAVFTQEDDRWLLG